uniref:PAK4-inhibitor INKA2 n=1 Tax=Taeniopygia guttata TaxID=59729 RepID=H0YT87_TAEGU
MKQNWTLTLGEGTLTTVLFPRQLSMKEVGDGLHEQMNCMMGALQELKLLQVQTALEHLDISGAGPGQDRGRCPPCPACPVPGPDSVSQPAVTPGSSQPRDSPCAPGPPCPVPTAWPPCHECPGCDDGHDWTSSLMSQSRTRQPLVLGDNVFADLVGNWLDLPELEKKGEKSEAALSASRSQELCRKFSLTANIFKKFLRSVRPDRDRLLKEKPCWLPPEEQRPDISKRSKKISKLKGTFYLPLHGNLAESRGERPKTGARRVPDGRGHGQAGFDINTAVWV